MTAVQTSNRSSVIWIALLLILGLVIAVAYLGRDGNTVGGPGDPNGTGPNGLKALRLFIEETGGTAETGVGLPDDSIDVAILVFPAIPQISFEDPDAPAPDADWGPLLAWVERGGILVTSVDVEGGPSLGGEFVEDDDAEIAQGLCSIDALAGVRTVRPLAYQPALAEPGDTSCFGTGGEGVVVERAVGAGRIVRLATLGPFTNRALDDADNGALAARVLRVNSEPTVGFLRSAPVFFVRGDDGEIILDGDGRPIEESGSPFGVPLDDDGNPIGGGDAGLLDLIPRTVIATLLAWAGALLVFALAMGRRLGSPVEEPVPVELPSSSYVEAVGRAYGRVEDARGRSTAILRHDLRADISRRVGMPADSSATDLAETLASGEARQAMVRVLDGPAPASDDALVATAQELVRARDRIDRGGVSAFADSDELAPLDDLSGSSQRKDAP